VCVLPSPRPGRDRHEPGVGRLGGVPSRVGAAVVNRRYLKFVCLPRRQVR